MTRPFCLTEKEKKNVIYLFISYNLFLFGKYTLHFEVLYFYSIRLRSFLSQHLIGIASKYKYSWDVQVFSNVSCLLISFCKRNIKVEGELHPLISKLKYECLWMGTSSCHI